MLLLILRAVIVAGVGAWVVVSSRGAGDSARSDSAVRPRHPTTAAVEPSLAGAFQRAVFLLNLNPIVWEQLRPDLDAVANALRAGGPDGERDADRLLSLLEETREISLPPPTPAPDYEPPPGGLPVDDDSLALPHAIGSRRIMELLTQTTNALVWRGLQGLDELDSPAARNAIARSRAAYDAFEPYLRALDPEGFGRLESAWQRLQAGGVADSADSRRAASRDEIVQYMSRNFGTRFAEIAPGRFVPGPTRGGRPSAPHTLGALLPTGSRIGRPRPRPMQILNSVERGAAERDMPLSSFGAAAFNNPHVFGEPARSLGISCNSCHEKSGRNPDFLVPGLSAHAGSFDVTNNFFAPQGNNAVFDPLDIPDLRGLRFTAPYGRNGRFASLRDFVRHVIVNEFNGPEPDPLLLDGLVVYMNEFDFLRNPHLDRRGGLLPRAGDAALRGEKLFARPFEGMGGMSCAACHIPSANFLDHKRHDIGTVRGFAEASLDRALDTPTLLGCAVTAPYFHDGSRPTLGAVVDWFNDSFRLGLMDGERADLTAYVAAVGAGARPFQADDQILAEDMEDQEAFLSVFEFLAEREKWGLIADLFRGISSELTRQRGIGHRDEVLEILGELHALMDAAGRDAESGRREAASAKVRQWRLLYSRHRFTFQ